MNDDREIIRLYTQLIQAVESNPGESRHQTAMRYIEEGKKIKKQGNKSGI